MIIWGFKLLFAKAVTQMAPEAKMVSLMSKEIRYEVPGRGGDCGNLQSTHPLRTAPVASTHQCGLRVAKALNLFNRS